MFKYSFIPKIMILPFLTQKVTHAWQVISICLWTGKIVNCFQFYYFLLKREKKKKKKKHFLISSVYIGSKSKSSVKMREWHSLDTTLLTREVNLTTISSAPSAE